MVEIVSQSSIEEDPEFLEKLASTVKNGGIIVFPTDTIYGIGCDPLNNEAVEKIFKIKTRLRSKGLPILCDNVESVKKIALIPDIASQYIDRYWPGKLTIILKATGLIPKEVTGSLDTIAVRIPGNDFTLKLISVIGGFLIGTSANKSNAEVPKDIKEIQAQISEEIDFIIDAGPVKDVKPSTILDITTPVPKIIRKGAQDV